MLLNFTDDYINTIENGRLLLGDIQLYLSQKEPYMGNSPALDRLYAQSIVISGIIDYFENCDNSNPREDEALLMCLRSAIDKNICRRSRNIFKDKTNYHVPLPYNPNPGGPVIVPYTPPKEENNFGNVGSFD